MASSQKGKKQYKNPIREAVERTSGRAYAGTRAAASKRITENSELKKSVAPRTVKLMSTNSFYDKLGVPKNKRNSVQFTAKRGKNNEYTVKRHRSDKKDPNTGFGMNVTQIRRVKVTTSGS